MGAGGTAAGYVISHLVEPYVGPPVFVSTVRCSPQSEGVLLSWGDRGHNTLAPAMGHAPACTRARRPRTRAMQLTGVGFLGKPLRAIFCFRHQDAQNPPSPLVGEGGKGDEGQARTGMQQTAHLSQELYP